MKKIVPFKKEIEFKTMISKITSISLEHTLASAGDNLITGHFIVEGTYKMTPASQIDEEFSYKIPVDIEIDSKYDISSVTLDIDDFTYDVLDDDKLELNISLSIDNLEEKLDRNDELETLDNLFLETTEISDFEIPDVGGSSDNNDDISLSNDDNKEENDNSIEDDKPVKEDNLTEIKPKCEQSQASHVESLFSSFKDDVETFKTYYVYIVKEEDTLDSILSKYNIDKDSLAEYNDLSLITTGSKIIIPSSKNE